MTAPSDPPRSAPSRAAAIWLLVAAAVALARLPVVAWHGAARAGASVAGVRRALTEPAGQRVERASGMSAALRAAIRAALPDDGRLVLYSPYGGAEFELDASDPRGEPARQVRTLFERAKNLLYPHPRDVHFARDADELATKLAPVLAGRLVVLDGTQGPTPLAVGGSYELLHREAIGSAGQLRLWRFVGAK